MSLVQICGIANVLFGLFLVLISLPLLGGRVGRNRLFGFRTRRALSSPQWWERVNRYGAERRTTWGLVIAFLGGLCIVTDSPSLFAFCRFAPLLAVIPGIQTVLFSRMVATEEA